MPANKITTFHYRDEMYLEEHISYQTIKDYERTNLQCRNGAVYYW